MTIEPWALIKFIAETPQIPDAVRLAFLYVAAKSVSDEAPADMDAWLLLTAERIGVTLPDMQEGYQCFVEFVRAGKEEAAYEKGESALVEQARRIVEAGNGGEA